VENTEKEAYDSSTLYKHEIYFLNFARKVKMGNSWESWI
jgi:hypothetical protein